MRELRRPRNDVSDSVDARLGGLHPFIGFDESAIGLNMSLLQANALSIGLAADGYENFLSFYLLRLPVSGEGH